MRPKPGNDLTISYNGADQIVTVSGKVASQEIREKIVICCGNVSSVAGVADNMESPPEPESTYHTVERGDTLSAISKKVYGNANLYNQIFEANRPTPTRSTPARCCVSLPRPDRFDRRHFTRGRALRPAAV